MTSLIDYFKQPLREIEKQYTKSELVLIGWRSREISAAMSRRMKENTDYYTDEEVAKAPEVPKQFLNEFGEIDGRKMTGDQMFRYFNALGLHPAIMQRSQPNPPNPPSP